MHGGPARTGLASWAPVFTVPKLRLGFRRLWLFSEGMCVWVFEGAPEVCDLGMLLCRIPGSRRGATRAAAQLAAVPYSRRFLLVLTPVCFQGKRS